MLKNQVSVINDFSGGQDTITPIVTMPLTSSPNMKNFHCAGLKNRLIKRGGFSKLNSSPVSSDNLDTFYSPGYQTFDQNWGDVTANTNISQGFKPNTSSTVTEIRLWLKVFQIPTGNINIQIQTDSAGVPSGSGITSGTSNNIDVTTLTSSYQWITFTFLVNPTLVAGTQYHIVLQGSFSISAVNYVLWGVDNYDLIYPNGNISVYGGASWTANVALQAIFEVYITGATNGLVGSALFDFSSKSMFLGVFGTTLYNMTKNSSGTPNGTWNSLLAITSSRYWTFLDWQSGTALINTDIGLYSYSGTGTPAIVPAAPISKFTVIWNNFIIAFGLRGSPNGYQYSAIQDFITWPAVNIFNNAFDSNDGDVVTGVRILRGKLYIFKRYSIWRLTYLGSNPTFQINQILSRGCPSNNCIKEVDLGSSIGTVLIFPTTDNKIAIFDGYNIQLINETLREKSNDLFGAGDDQPIALSDINYTYADLFHAVVRQDTSEYILYCVLNNDTTVKYGFVLDWKTGGVYPYDNQIFSSSLFTISTNKLNILYTSGYTGYTWQMDSGNSDDGSAINAYWVSGKIKAQSVGLLTKLLQLFLYIKQISSGSGLTMNFQYRCDWNVSWNDLTSFNYDRNDSLAFGETINFDIGTIENMFQIKIQDNSTQPAGTIYGVDLFGTPLGTEVEDRAVS